MGEAGDVELTRFRGHVLSGERKESTMARARTYSQAFRDQMVELVRSGRTPEALSREFEPAAETIRGWVRAADEAGGSAEGGTPQEQEELKRLRREVAQLREEREILAKAAAWFARETDAKSTRSSRS
jgi:transposase